MSVGDPRSAAGGVEEDNLDTAAIALWSFVSVIGVVIVILVAVALYNQRDQLLYRTRVVAADTVEANQALHEQRGLLADYRAPQPGSDYYIIPVDEAKKLVLKELAQEKSDE